MSELKGQILGVLLVVVLFAGVAGFMSTFFQSTQETITQNLDTAFEDNGITTSNA